jgi:hypothetical protein
MKDKRDCSLKKKKDIGLCNNTAFNLQNNNCSLSFAMARVLKQ